MKTLTHVLTVLALVALLAAPVAAQTPAASQAPTATSLKELLGKVKAGWKVENQENKQREKRFAAAKDDQARLLAEAKATQKREEDRSTELEKQFADNEESLARLEDRLAEELGSLGELFGVVRQVAGDTRSNVFSSLISAEFPGRTEFLEALGQNKALPAISDLEGLWYTLQQEATESGTVTRFDSEIKAPDGTSRQASVVRVGPFVAIADGGYLKWEPEAGYLQMLPRQPPGRFLSTLSNLDPGASGLVRVAVDPARGTLLDAVIQTKTFFERVPDGGAIGYAIITLGSVTFLLALVRLAYIVFVGRRVKSQMKTTEARTNNPLGRILGIYKEHDTVDTETLELKLDEAILRENSGIEKYLWAIKVVAAIAPLMGLLGTVTGMIQTFQAITLFGTGDPKLMADGIAIALVTTMLGLCVAIPLVLLHSVVASMAKVITDTLEEQSAGLVATRAEGGSA